MRPKLAITLDRNPQQNKTTALRNVKYRVILRIVAFTSEDKFFTFFRIARHVVLFRPCHELFHKVITRITLITNRSNYCRVISIFEKSGRIVIRNFQVIQKYTKWIRPAYASLGGSLVLNDLPVIEVIIRENSLLPSKKEAMVPMNDVRLRGSCLRLADNLL